MRSPSPLAGQLVSLCRSCLGAILLLFHRYSFPVVHRRHRLTEDILALCLDLSTPSTLPFPESLVPHCLVCRCVSGRWAPPKQLSSAVWGQSFISVMGSIWCTRKPHLPVGVRLSISSAVGNDTGVEKSQWWTLLQGPWSQQPQGVGLQHRV